MANAPKLLLPMFPSTTKRGFVPQEMADVGEEVVRCFVKRAPKAEHSSMVSTPVRREQGGRKCSRRKTQKHAGLLKSWECTPQGWHGGINRLNPAGPEGQNQ